MRTPSDELGRVECFRPGLKSTRFPNAPDGYLLAGDAGCPQGGFGNYLGAVAPRLGFAKTFGAKTVVRGGFGLFWSPLSAIQYNNFVDSAPFSPQVTASGVPFDNPYVNQANPFPGSFAPFLPPQNVAFSTPLGSFGVFDAAFRPSYMESFNLTLERALSRDTNMRVSYIGNNGRHLSLLNDLNYARYTSGATVANTQQRRPLQSYASILNSQPTGSSSYNGLQIDLDRRAQRGVSIAASYTFAKSIDLQSLEAQPGQGTAIIPGSVDLNRGSSDFDVKHRLVVTHVLQLPKLANRSMWIRQSVGGWQLSGIWTVQSGLPFTVTSGVDQSRSGLGVDRADRIGDPRLDTSRSRAELAARYFNTAAYRTNTLGTFGNASRNALYGPGLFNADTALLKPFPIVGETSFELRVEAFNVFNRTNLNNPNASVSSSTFGRITSAASPRILQFAAKFKF